MLTTRLVFSALWLLVVVQRLWEVQRSKRHEAKLRAQGAVEHAAGQMPWMIALHAAWLVGTLGEVWLLRRPLVVALALPAFALFMLGQALRITAMRTLGERWTVKVITPVGGGPAVARGIYRYVRHPNYLGVVLEIAALPLMHGAYLSAALFSALNGILLWRRIGAEERALASTSSYADQFRGRPRFIPGAARP
ncbi:MAG TPA: isoprenylcysteine carboxylmethyltransferase family protein [Polyangiales bacterium]